MTKDNVVRVLIVTLNTEPAAKIAEVFKQAINTKSVEELIPDDFEITVATNKVQAIRHVNDPGYELIIASPEAINELWPSFLAKFADGAIIYPAIPKGETVSESIKRIAQKGKILEY